MREEEEDQGADAESQMFKGRSRGLELRKSCREEDGEG